MKKRFPIMITLCCLVVCTLVLSGFADSRDANNRFDPSHIYEVNQAGQTYGSAMYAASPEKEPDLVLAEGLDGTQGYVYSSDLNADMVDSPEEALLLIKKYKEMWENAPVGEVVVARYIPLYDSDGKTIIGDFPITIGFKESNDTEFPGTMIKGK